MLALILSVLATAGTTTESFDEQVASPPGLQGCGTAESVEAVASVEIDFTQAQITDFFDIEIVAEGKHKNCGVTLDDVEITLDGASIWSRTISVSSRGRETEDWHLSRSYNAGSGIPTIDDEILIAGRHTLEARLRGQAEGSSEQVRVRITGSYEYGRDWDDDGHDADVVGGDDCDDEDATVSPSAEEVWYDGVDQDCDGASDYDRDRDGHDADVHGGDDCDDGAPGISPSAVETWYDGVDQDCDGASDFDQDLDGFDSDDHDGEDCDDLDPAIRPDADEIWYDGVDQDCDGASDFDQDADGFDSDDHGGDDCDDVDGSVNPDAPETWYDGVDQDCDGADDFDQDEDGYPRDEDCSDEDATAFPGARGWTDDCEWTVDDDGTRPLPAPGEPGAPAGQGCACDGPTAPPTAVALLLPLLLLRRRR